MTKWKDTTKGGHKILWREELKEGEHKGWSCGRIRVNNISYTALWDEDGYEIGGHHFNLVPAEPEVVHTKYINVYEGGPGFHYEGNAQWPSEYDGCLGRIRIDWLNNGTYTVTKEEV